MRTSHFLLGNEKQVKASESTMTYKAPPIGYKTQRQENKIVNKSQNFAFGTEKPNYMSMTASSYGKQKGPQMTAKEDAIQAE